MASPIDQMILSSVKCVKCGAGYGKCNCWSKCTKCGCSYETGGKCGRCAGEPMGVIAMGTMKMPRGKKK